MKYSTIYILLLVTLLSCSKANEEEVYISKEVGVFHTVEFNSAFEVILVQDSSYYIEIMTVESLEKHMKIQLNNEVLTLTNTKSLKWTNPKNNIPTVYVHCANFQKVVANKSCNFNTLTPITGYEFGIVLKDKANYANLELDCNVFFYWNNFPAGGKLTLSGKTDELKLWNTAIMSVDAKNLVTAYAMVENNSKGICEVNVTNKIEYNIKGKGDIHLYGKPTEIVETEPSAGGKLINFIP